MTLSTNPPRGTADRYPEEFRIRNHIFATWREVCQRFGYEEYLGPLVEDSAIWKAKSGEDVGGTELTLLTDREGNISELALRPEMTPTVTRMVSKKWNELPKPVRWFSIANFYRNERPQRGRNREFWQLNVDLFGEMGSGADLEILTLSMELMKAFGATPEHIELRINHRRLIDTFLLNYVEDTTPLVRLLDKWAKLKPDAMHQALADLGISASGIQDIHTFMHVVTVEELQDAFPYLAGEASVVELKNLVEHLTLLGYGDYLQFSPSLMRGFDYYDGMVFEVFDKHPDNNRALFGGGRYNGLAEIFGVKEPLAAVGFAPGDETMKLFLESRGLDSNITNNLSDMYYLPILDVGDELATHLLAMHLRTQGQNVEISLGVKKLGKAFQYAEKKGYGYVVIYGTDERAQGVYTLKHLISGKEEVVKYTI